MSGIWIQILQFVTALSLLVLLHEMGHYFFARLFKTRVERFYLFFDFLFPFSNLLPFSLFKKKVGETTYGIGWFPLGGYVKIAGMVDESMDTEQMKQPPQPWEFRSKKAWQRLLIMLGGIIVNVITAFIIYAMVLFVWGQKKLPMSQVQHGIMITDSLGYQLGFKDGDRILNTDNKEIVYYEDLMPQLLAAKSVTLERNGQVMSIDLPVNFVEQLIDNKGKGIFELPFHPIVGEVQDNSNALKAGLLTSDRLLAVNHQSTPFFMDFKRALDIYKGEIVTLSVLRNNDTLQIQAEVSKEGFLGFRPLAVLDKEKGGLYQLEDYKYGFFAAFPAGIKMSVEKLRFYIDQFKLMLNPETGAYKGIGGFGSMTKIYSPSWDWHHFWSVTAFISLILAFMNLLPIPGLDGGYVMFILFEMITGKKVNDNVMGIANTFGLILLLILMLYANGMDIFRAFSN